MRQKVEEMIKVLGLEIVDSDNKTDEETRGYIVIKNNDSYVKVSFYEDSYNDGYITDIKTVTPRSIKKVIYE